MVDFMCLHCSMQGLLWNELGQTLYAQVYHIKKVTKVEVGSLHRKDLERQSN